MKNNRKRNSINKAEKLARKSLIKEVLVVYLSLLFVILLLLLAIAADSKLNFFYFLSGFWPALPIPIAIYLLSIVAYWFFRKQDHINSACKKINSEYSKKLAEQLLVPGKPVKVVLSKTRMDVYPDFFKGLQQDNIAEFYAILGIVDDLISIHARFNADGKEILLDVISKDEFTTYCDVKEETL